MSMIIHQQFSSYIRLHDMLFEEKDTCLAKEDLPFFCVAALLDESTCDTMQNSGMTPAPWQQYVMSPCRKSDSEVKGLLRSPPNYLQVR